MNKMIKILISIITMFVIISTTPISAHGGAYEDTATEEEKIKNEEISRRKDREQTFSRMLRSGGSSFRVLNVPVMYQETDYYCGPAVAQMIIKHVTGRTIPQSTLARDMGTTKENGTGYWALGNELNAYRGLIDYYAVRNTNERDFFTSLEKTIDDNHPIVILINHTQRFDSGYGFDGGHFILGRGYDHFGERNVYFIDPYPQSPVAGKGKKELNDILYGMKHKETDRGWFIY